MPLYVSIPLPGPFRYVARASCRHTSRFGSGWYWVLGVWALEGAFWLLIGLVALLVVAFQYVVPRRWFPR